MGAILIDATLLSLRFLATGAPSASPWAQAQRITAAKPKHTRRVLTDTTQTMGRRFLAGGMFSDAKRELRPSRSSAKASLRYIQAWLVWVSSAVRVASTAVPGVAGVAGAADAAGSGAPGCVGGADEAYMLIPWLVLATWS